MQETLHDGTKDDTNTAMLERTMDGFRRFQLFKLANESGLFAWLEERGAVSAHRIIDAMHWSPHHGQLLLKALQEEGYLELAGNRLQSVWPSARGATAQLMAAQAAWERLPAMLALQQPRAAADPEAIWQGTRNAELEREQVASAVLSWAGIGDARRLLDLGGTEAEVAMALCAAYPQLHAEVLIEHGRRAAVQRKLLDVGLEQRITLFERDMTSLDLQGNYDIVLAVHCFYAFPQAVLQTMENLAAHLRPGGFLVSLHSFEDGRSTAGLGAAQLLERCMAQSRAPLHYPDAYADRISSAGFRLLRTEGCMVGEQGSWLHVAQRCAA
jgi:SAM-dependent methyltransferase